MRNRIHWRWHVPLGAQWSIGDQALSSATNLALSVLVASSSSARTFGAVGVIVAAYLLEVSVLRGAVGDLYTVYRSEDGGLVEKRQAVGATTAIAVGLAVVHAGVGLAFGGTMRSLLLAFALLTPGLLLQDTSRLLLLAEKQVRRSFTSNVVWAGIQVLGSGAVYLTTRSAAGYLIAWGVAGTGSAVYSLGRLGVAPIPAAGMEWFRRFRGLSAGWALEYLATVGPAQLLTWGIGAVGGLAELAAYRGALVLVGPATVLLAGIRIVCLPAAAATKHDVPRFRQLMQRMELALCAGALMTTLPLLAMPDFLGRTVLGVSWGGTAKVLPFVVLDRIAAATSVASVIGLRVARAHRQLFLLRVLTAVAGVGLGMAGAVWGGAVGSAAGFGVVTLVTLPLWRGSYRRAIRTMSDGVLGGSKPGAQPVGWEESVVDQNDERLVQLRGRLRLLRRRLDDVDATVAPSEMETGTWDVDLDAYDQALLGAADVLGVPVPAAARKGLTSEHRAGLEAGLAEAGLDVRGGEK
jgi:hypothetical protein